ncbi:MAG TPA: thioesterase family protein [Solirubrobacterales bacterium]|nr:thioesterase family protein [Solirubrobacterales bacterium]
MSEAFYLPAAEGFIATELTRGPWDPGAQHGGPPSALLGREIERVDGGGGFQIGRVTVEILRPVPIGPLRVEAQVARPGRRVQLIEASLWTDDGEVMKARAWRLRKGEVEIPDEVAAAPAPPPGPEQGDRSEFFHTGQSAGYHTAMEWRSVGGGFLQPGPATVWMRMGCALVAGEEPTPLQRTLVAADVGNGISAVLDWRRYLFINVDLSVYLERMPEGEWICVDALTLPQASGVGTAESVLFDQRGRIGRAAQALLIAERA